MKYLKLYNESVRDFLKPKSDEDIIKGFKNMKTYNILKMSIDHNLKSGFKYLVDNDLICVNLKYIIEKYQMGLHQNEPPKGYEKWLLKQLTGLEIFRSTVNSDVIIYKKDDNVLFNYNEKNKSFYIEFKNIETVLRGLSLVSHEIYVLVQGMAEKYLNIEIDKVGSAWTNTKHGRQIIIK